MLSIPEIPAGTDILTAALKYAEHDLYVGPLKKGDKHPGGVLGKGWQHQSSREAEQVVAWFAGTDYDVFIHAGRSGLVIFDVDRPGLVPENLGEHLLAAPYQSTRLEEHGRGHYVFTQPAGRSIGNGVGRLGSPWGDVRGLNGIVVAAPSDGGRYRWMRTGEIPMLPAALAELLDDSTPGEDAATDEQVRAFIAEHTAASRPGALEGRLKGYREALGAGNGRHSTTLPFLTGALEESRAGFYSAQAAVDGIWPLFLEAVSVGPNSRSEVRARSEFAGLLSWAVGQALAADLEAVRARVNAALPDYDEILRNSAKGSQPAAPRKTLPKVSTTVLSTVTAERVRWLWPGRLPKGKLVTLDGDPGLGKSTLAVDFIAHITTGAEWPDGATPEYTGAVVFFSAEDGLADTVRPRVEAAGGDSNKVVAVNGVPTGFDDEGTMIVRPLTLADVAAIEAAIVEHGAILAVVDVLMAFLPGSTDSHRDQDVRRVLSQLSAIADRTGCTFVFIRHLTKGSGKGDPMYRGGGSIGIIGAARLGLAVARDPEDDDRRVLAVVKSNLAKIAPSLAYRLQETPPHDVARVVWEGEVDYTAAELLSDGSERVEPFSQVWLAAFLQDGRRLSSEVKAAAEADGIRERTLKAAAKRLGVTYSSEGFPRMTYWELPSRASDPQHPPDCPTAQLEESNAVSRSRAVGQSGVCSEDSGPTDSAVEKSNAEGWPLCAAGCGDPVNPAFGDTHSVCAP